MEDIVDCCLSLIQQQMFMKTYYVPGSVLGAWDPSVYKDPFPPCAHVPVGEEDRQ